MELGDIVGGRVIVHEQLLGENVPGHIGVQVGVLVHQLLDDESVHFGMKVCKLFGEPQMGPDHNHARVTGEQGVPDLK